MHVTEPCWGPRAPSIKVLPEISTYEKCLRFSIRTQNVNVYQILHKNLKLTFIYLLIFHFNFYFLLESGVKEGQILTKHTLSSFANHDFFSWYNKHLSSVGGLNQNTNKARPAVAACQTFPPRSSASLVSHSISDTFNQTDRVIRPSQQQDLYSYTFRSLASRKKKKKNVSAFLKETDKRG